MLVLFMNPLWGQGQTWPNSSSETACLFSLASVEEDPRLAAGATQSLAHVSVWPYVGLAARTLKHGLYKGIGPMVAGLKDKCA